MIPSKFTSEPIIRVKMSGYGRVDSPSIVSLEREIFNNSGFFLRGFFFFFLFSDFIDPIQNKALPGIRKVKEKKKKKVWGWGLGGGGGGGDQGCFKRVEKKKKKTYSFHLVVASLSIALLGLNCPSAAPAREGCVVLAVASVPTGHSWD